MGRNGVDVETKLNYRQKQYAFFQYYYPFLAFEEDMPFHGKTTELFTRDNSNSVTFA